jgi:hypothetical protein
MAGKFGALTVMAISALAMAQAPDPGCRPIPDHRGRVASPSSTPALFDLHSNFWVNLHHFLYSAARAQAGLDAGRPVSASVRADTMGFGALPISDQNTWRAAVAYYASTLARHDILFDSGMVAINNQLTRTDPTSSASTLSRSGLDPSLVAILEHAAPVYRRVWWARHDAANREWETTIRRLLASYGDSLAARESRAFREAWSTVPIRVDVTAYANWAGAYTTTDPTHITVSSEDPGNQNDQALEILFHEVLHTMDDTLASALNTAFRARGKVPPRDATHAFIFYTAGAETQRMIPAHVPYAEKNGLWERVADLKRALPVLRRGWQPYLDGKITFADAIELYVATLGRDQP